jgi:hypothetical protein
MWRSILVQRAVKAALREKGKTLDDRSQMVGVHGNRFILHEVFNRLGEVVENGPAENLKSPGRGTRFYFAYGTRNSGGETLLWILLRQLVQER